MLVTVDRFTRGYHRNHSISDRRYLSRRAPALAGAPRTGPSSDETEMKSRLAFRGHLSLVVLLALGGLVAAQTPPRSTPGEFETRADLEAQLRIADSQHRT